MFRLPKIGKDEPTRGFEHAAYLLKRCNLEATRQVVEHEGACDQIDFLIREWQLGCAAPDISYVDPLLTRLLSRNSQGLLIEIDTDHPRLGRSLFHQSGHRPGTAPYIDDYVPIFNRRGFEDFPPEAKSQPEDDAK